MLGIMCYIHIIFGHEKKEILPSAIARMNLEGITLNEVCQKDKYCMISHVESKKENLIEKEIRFVVTRAGV